MTFRGCEWIVDAHGCDPVRLGDLDALQTLFARLIAILGLHPVSDAMWHRFPAPTNGGGGITGLALLAESHLAVHTFPEHGTLCLNVFCCRARDDWDADAALAPFAGTERLLVHVRRVERQLTPAADGWRDRLPAGALIPKP